MPLLIKAPFLFSSVATHMCLWRIYKKEKAAAAAAAKREGKMAGSNKSTDLMKNANDVGSRLDTPST